MLLKNSFDKIVPTEQAQTPSDLRWPTFCMVAPFKDSFNTAVANNVWMKELPPEKQQVNYDKAFQQFMELEQWIAANSLTYLIPNAGQFQDLIYCANIGIYIEPADVIVASNFTSEPRIGEEQVGADFFKRMKYTVLHPPAHFEGEADLKFQRDNIFVGGYGIRTDKEAFDWMEKQCNIQIIKCLMTDERQYHFDCLYFPLTMEKALVCTELFQPADLAEIEKVVEVIDIPKPEAYAMSTNCVRVGQNILVASEMTEMHAGDEPYINEVTKLGRLGQICSRNGLNLVSVNLSEFNKSGAALSCLVFHCNYVDYQSPMGEVF
jgi:N-dimethylarginine dimethylaminohydrolase